MALTAEKIRKSYINYLLEEGHEPASIFKFAKSIKSTEKEFYEFYNSFAQVEKEIWKNYVHHTIDQITNDQVYAGYSIREKLLAFHYTLIETLKEERSFILVVLKNTKKSITSSDPDYLEDAKKTFMIFANELMLEGRETREVENRPIPQVMQRYPKMLWMATKSVIDFWASDESQAFEKTDTMIEKMVNTSMDWIGRSPLDSLFDLGKFMYQNGKGMKFS